MKKESVTWKINMRNTQYAAQKDERIKKEIERHKR